MFKAFLEPFLAEQNRWFLWSPVFLGLGIVGYFSLPQEPPLWPGMAALLACLMTIFLCRHSVGLPLAMGLGLVVLGFFCAQVETRMMAQPMLKEKYDAQEILGRVMVINHLPDGFRLWLSDVQAENIPVASTPRMVRIKFRYQEKAPEAGEWVNVSSMLYPLSQPAEPNGFDFRRFAFFQGYGATGFATSGWHHAEGPEPGFFQRFWLFFERLRSRMNALFLQGEKTPEAAIAAALVSGDQSGIDTGTLAAMRASGISHILSVSGLHIALVAGIVFFVVRFSLACVPFLALAWPIKKMAALFALAAALFYTLLCAAPVPAVRSMVMSGLVLVAVLFDRRALSMRLVTVAALLTLVFAPSALMDPSFQLSFGAVMALVAAFEKHEAQLWQRFRAEGVWGKIGQYVQASLASSLIASVATAPIILYTFQQVNWYGVVTNLVAVPLSSFIIMPMGLLAALAMPLGLEAWPLAAMKEGIHGMIECARFVASLPGAITYHPALPPYALGMIAGGGLWFCLWQRRWRFWGLLPLLCGTLSFLVTPRPDILMAADGITLALRTENGPRIVRAAEREDFTVKTWLQRDGLGPDGWREAVNYFDAAETQEDPDFQCQGHDCIYARKGLRIGLPMRRPSASAMCSTVDVLITPFDVPCGEKAVNARGGGARAFFIRHGKWEIQEAISAQRPWN